MSNVIQNKANSNLVMRDVFFPVIEVRQNKDLSHLGHTQLRVEYKVQMSTLTDCEHGKTITIVVDIIPLEDERIRVHIEAVGVFELLHVGKMSNEDIENVFKYNAVAIMLPFIRSQVSLATTQPGVSPILLQPVDVTKLYGE